MSYDLPDDVVETVFRSSDCTTQLKLCSHKELRRGLGHLCIPEKPACSNLGDPEFNRFRERARGKNLNATFTTRIFLPIAPMQLLVSIEGRISEMGEWVNPKQLFGDDDLGKVVDLFPRVPGQGSSITLSFPSCRVAWEKDDEEVEYHDVTYFEKTIGDATPPNDGDAGDSLQFWNRYVFPPNRIDYNKFKFLRPAGQAFMVTVKNGLACITVVERFGERPDSNAFERIRRIVGGDYLAAGTTPARDAAAPSGAALGLDLRLIKRDLEELALGRISFFRNLNWLNEESRELGRLLRGLPATR